MTKPNGKRMKLAEMRAQRADALGGRSVDIELSDGSVIEIPRRMFWPKDVIRQIQAADDVQDEDVLKMVLPAADFKKLMAEATEIGDLVDIMREVSDEAGLNMGESSGSSNS